MVKCYTLSLAADKIFHSCSVRKSDQITKGPNVDPLTNVGNLSANDCAFSNYYGPVEAFRTSLVPANMSLKDIAC